MQAVGALAPDDAIVTTDVGQHQMWVAQRFPFARPDRWLTSGGLGTMGFGLPAAIGAALVAPEATTLCFTGDGSLLMNVQELATLAELDLNVKIVLLDNAALGLVRQQQELFYQRRFVACEFAQPSRFVAIAQAFGMLAIDLGEASAPHEALKTRTVEPRAGVDTRADRSDRARDADGGAGRGEHRRAGSRQPHVSLLEDCMMTETTAGAAHHLGRIRKGRAARRHHPRSDGIPAGTQAGLEAAHRFRSADRRAHVERADHALYGKEDLVGQQVMAVRELSAQADRPVPLRGTGDWIPR